MYLSGRHVFNTSKYRLSQMLSQQVDAICGLNYYIIYYALSVLADFSPKARAINRLRWHYLYCLVRHWKTRVLLSVDLIFDNHYPT